METLLNTVDKTTLVILLAASSMCAVLFLICTSYARTSRGAKIAHESVSRFSKEVKLLWDKKNLLGEYTPEYFHAMQEGGWDDLNKTLKSLLHVEEKLQNLLRSRNYDAASLLSEYLLGNLIEDDLEIARETFKSFTWLEDWKTNTNNALIAVSKSLSDAAIVTQELGVDRSRRKRRPTLAVTSEMFHSTPKE